MTRAEIEARKAEMRDVLALRAGIIEDAIRFNEETKGLFCMGDNYREIHVFSPKFQHVSECMQAVVTFNPNWNERYPNIIEAYFYTELYGKRYKVYSLLDKEGKK